MKIKNKDKYFLNIDVSLFSASEDRAFEFYCLNEATGEIKICSKDDLKKRKIPVNLLIPFENGLIREIQLPWINRKERDSALKYYIQQEIPILLKDFIFDYQVIEDENKRNILISLMAARKDKITKYIEIVEKAGYVIAGINYAIVAIGECLALAPSETAILLQTISEDRVQLVVYQENSPKSIHEIVVGTDNIAKSHLYLALNGYKASHAYVLTDRRVLSERVASLLIDNGFAPKQKSTWEIFLQRNKKPLEIEYQQLAVFGESKRIKQKNYVNLYNPFLRPKKIRLLTIFTGLALGTIILFISLNWYPKSTELSKLQEEVGTLQQQLLELDRDYNNNMWSAWRQEHKASKRTMEKVLQASLSLNNNSLNRINYKQDTLFLWLECKESSELTVLMGKLSAEGWKEPSLIDYKYTPARIKALVSVKR